MATFAQLKAEQERRDREAMALHDKLNNLHPIDLCLQYTLDSGTRCTITGIFGRRLDITCSGGNPWAEEEGVKFLTLGMLSVDDLREFLEIRLVIEAFKAGRLAELPMPKEPFGSWVCPSDFAVPIFDGDE